MLLPPVSGVKRGWVVVLGLTPKLPTISGFLRSLQCSSGGKYGYFKCLRAFYNWLYSPKAGLGFKAEANPVTWVEAPKRPLLILPALTRVQVESLIDKAGTTRDRAIISLFTESGLRLFELTNIRPHDIDWDRAALSESWARAGKRLWRLLVSYPKGISKHGWLSINQTAISGD